MDSTRGDPVLVGWRTSCAAYRWKLFPFLSQWYECFIGTIEYNVKKTYAFTMNGNDLLVKVLK